MSCGGVEKAGEVQMDWKWLSVNMWDTEFYSLCFCNVFEIVHDFKKCFNIAKQERKDEGRRKGEEKGE